ncbi:EndoU domain-containing protein, partial [Kitasatospora putterlickiae]|uniref:EndoU domain-containing protein n=1 Tax=Kitasatospora putterlickiae TaxID=221725 RepID=UPI0031D3737F
PDLTRTPDLTQAPTPPTAPRPPAGTDESGRHDVQEPLSRGPRPTESLASLLADQGNPRTRPVDDLLTPAARRADGEDGAGTPWSTPSPLLRQDQAGPPQQQSRPRPVDADEPAPVPVPGPVPVPVPVPVPSPVHHTAPAGGSDLRPGYASTTVTPPAGPHRADETPSPLRSYEARYGTLPTGGRATELVVKLHLDTARVQEFPDRVAALRRRVLEGAAEAYNSGHRLPDGSVLRVRVEFTDAPDTADQTVRLHGTTVRQDEANWGLTADRDALGHQIGRILGLREDSREVYREGGTDRSAGGPAPQRLRTVGAVLAEAFGVGPGPGAPERPLVPQTVRTTSLYGSDGPDGAGGHLLRTAVRQAHADGLFRENPNRTVHLDPAAGSGERGRTFFPSHWTADEAVYAAEQAFRDSRGRGPDAPHWEGEYAGVRIAGEQRDGVITGFRPVDDQGSLTPPPYAPRRPAPPGPDDLGRPREFGDRRSLDGV